MFIMTMARTLHLAITILIIIANTYSLVWVGTGQWDTVICVITGMVIIHMIGTGTILLFIKQKGTPTTIILIISF